MRHWDVLLEPVLQSIVSERTKERHDAIIKLKALLEDSQDTPITSVLAQKVVSSLVRMLKIDLKVYLGSRNRDHIEPVVLSSAQSNKIIQLMKEFRCILTLIDSFPEISVLESIPSLANFLIDCLNSDLSLIYSDVLFILRSFMLSKKPYLLSFNMEQIDQLLKIFAFFIFETEMSTGTESDICTCIFFLSMIIPNQPKIWSPKILHIYELLHQLLILSKSKNHESPAFALLFRTVNYILYELKYRDPENYSQLLAYTHTIMESFGHFKTGIILEEYLIFFLSNAIPPSPILAANALQEFSKSRLKPHDLDPFKLADNIFAYVSRNREFSYEKGYIPYLVSLEFCAKYLPDDSIQPLYSGNISLEALSYHLFNASRLQNLVSWDILSALLDSTALNKKGWISAIIIARLRFEKIKDHSLLERLYKQAISLSSKQGSADFGCRLAACILRLKPELVHIDPKFEGILENLNFSDISRESLNWLTLLYGFSFRGLWWSSNSFEAYKSVCQLVVKIFETNKDARGLLDQLFQNAFELALLLSIPFNAFLPSIKFSPQKETECFTILPQLLSSTVNDYNSTVDFQASLSSGQRSALYNVFKSLVGRLQQCILSFGFQSCKQVSADYFHNSLKEDNFATVLLQPLLVYCAFFQNDILSDLYNHSVLPWSLDEKNLMQLQYLVNQSNKQEGIFLVSKFTIQSFEIFKTKKESRKEFSSNIPSQSNSIWHIRPFWFLESPVDKKASLSYKYFEVLLAFYQKICSMNLRVQDLETRYFVEDFKVYLMTNFKKHATESAVFLKFLPEIPFTTNDKLKEAGEILKISAYRHDEVAIRALICFLSSAFHDEPLELKTIKEFIGPLFKIYLNWGFAAKTKELALNLFIKCFEFGGMPKDDLFKIFLDPCHYNIDILSNIYVDVAHRLGQDFLVDRVVEDPSFWNSITSTGQALSKLKFLKILITNGFVDVKTSTFSFLNNFPRNILESLAGCVQVKYEFEQIFGKDLQPICLYLFKVWISENKPVQDFPVNLFLNCTDLNSLLLHPIIFQQIAINYGIEQAQQICCLSLDLIKSNFSALVAIALVRYFESCQAETDKILTSFLKETMGPTEFEAHFRDNVLQIIRFILEIDGGNGCLAESCFGHISTMFKYDSTAEIWASAYLAQAFLLFLEDTACFPYDPSPLLSSLSCISSKSPQLLSNPIFLSKIFRTVQEILFAFAYPPSIAWLQIIEVLLDYVHDSNDLDGINRRIWVSVAMILTRLLRYQHIASSWFNKLITKSKIRNAAVLGSVLDILKAILKEDLELKNTSTFPETPIFEDILCTIFAYSDSIEFTRRIVRLYFNKRLLTPKISSTIVSVVTGNEVLESSLSKLPDYGLIKTELIFQTGTFTSNSLDIPKSKHGKKSLTETILDLTKNNYYGTSITGFRLLMENIAQLLNSEGICSPGQWNGLPSSLRDQFDFLRLVIPRKRLLFSKSKRPILRAYSSYPEYWESQQTSDIKFWIVSLSGCLTENFCKNPLFLKLLPAFTVDNWVFCQDILPYLYEESMIGENHQILLTPIRNFLSSCQPKANSMHALMLRCLVSVFQHLLKQRPISFLDIDYKTLATTLFLGEIDRLAVLYFFEMGLQNFENIERDDMMLLTKLYSAVEATDYTEAFSKLFGLETRSAFDLLLEADIQQCNLGEMGKEALWELQQWDLEDIPTKTSLNQDMIDIYSLLRDVSLNVCVEERRKRINNIGLCFDLSQDNNLKICAVKKCWELIDSEWKLAANFNQADEIDVSILSMMPDKRSELFELTAGLLFKYRNENCLTKMRKLSGLIENIVKAYKYESMEETWDLLFLLKGEQARLLWERDKFEEAIDLMKNALPLIPNCPINDVFTREYVALVLSQTGEWIFSNKSEPPLSIKENYLDYALKIIGGFPSNPKSLAKIYFTYAKFVDHLFDQMSKSENLEFREKLVAQAKQDIEALTKLAASRREDSILRSLKSLEQQYHADLKEFNEIERNRTCFLQLAVESYLRCLQLVDTFDLSVFRVCSLWFLHYSRVPEITKLISNAFGKVACHKFLPLIYQLAARAELSEIRTTEQGIFQETLEKLLIRMASKHPYHSVYQILALKAGTLQKSGPMKRRLIYSSESLDDRRAAAAAAIISKLKTGDTRVSKIISGIEKICEAYIEMAETELPSDTKTNTNHPFDAKWMIRKLGACPEIAVLTRSIPVDPSGVYKDVVTIAGFGENYRVVGGINLPKIIDCIGSDGRVYRQLVKGKDDVRQDAVMEQVFLLVDSLLKSNEATRKRGLVIRTYRIIPLHSLAGVLEWIIDTIPLGDYLLPAHERIRPQDMTIKSCRAALKAEFDDSSSTPASKLQTFKKILARFQPVLHHFFYETSQSPSDWWSRKCAYVSSCAASSMLGYMVGLGDRHCQNILLDRRSGEMIQIDLNMIFEMGKSLRIPERVPFRLTRDIVDGMGPAGTKGGFERASEETLRLLRSQSETILMILEVFKYDPLYKWNLNPLKAARKMACVQTSNLVEGLGLRSLNPGAGPEMEESHVPPEADRALLRVKEKLLGCEEGSQLSERGQVQYLIQQASSIEALSQMYPGWSPWI